MFRFLLTPKIDMKCLCLQAMAIVYGRHHEDIGPFNDTKYILAMLDRNTFLHQCWGPADFLAKSRLTIPLKYI